MGYGFIGMQFNYFLMFGMRVYESIFAKVLQILEGRGRAAVAYYRVKQGFYF
jgi:hypothetical protein